MWKPVRAGQALENSDAEEEREMSKHRLIKHPLCVAVLGFLLLLGVGCLETDQGTADVQSQAPAYTGSANALYAEYEANEVAADAKYKGKIVIVSGIIRSIGKDIVDQAYIVIGGGGFLDGVQCMFTASENNSVAGLAKGQSVTVKGQVSGKILGNVLLIVNVLSKVT
jgi:hypothetical protein